LGLNRPESFLTGSKSSLRTNLPCVIDSQNDTLADIRIGLLTEHNGRSLDLTTAYFTVGEFWIRCRSIAALLKPPYRYVS
jgi:hypothetical protein